MMYFVLLLVFAFNPQQDPSIIASNTSGNKNSSHLSLCQRWSLHKLMSRRPGRLIYSELNFSCCQQLIYWVSCSGGDQLAVGYMSVSIALVTVDSLSFSWQM